MSLYAGGYKGFKHCLVDAWPEGKVAHCAHMVMLDVGFPIHLVDGSWCVFRDIQAFTMSIHMPTPFSGHTNVSTYLATHYPKTSTALFDGKSKEFATKILMAEKANKSAQRRAGSFKEAVNENKKAEGYITIKMRSLTKKYDWNTVK
jgi:hypothetical protein